LIDDPASAANVEVKLSPLSQIAKDLTTPLARGLIQTCLVHHKCGDPFRHPVVLPLDDEYSVLPEGASSDGVIAPADDGSRNTVMDTVPARLIALQAFEDSLDACLFDVPENSITPGQQAFYAALSYCWGPNSKDMYKTTTETISSRKERIVWSDLPPTFQDAFRIARDLEIPYIWIDALCIIQDSGPDWEQESAKMGGIYASSLVTISADASDSVKGGILNLASAEGEGTRNHVKITTVLQDGQRSSLCFYDVSSTAPGTVWSPQAILDGPVSTRAWCMQERMLSPRIMHFTKEGFIWECREKYASLQMISSMDEEANSRTLSGAVRCLVEGLSGNGWGLSVPALEDFGAGSADMTDENIDLFNAMFESGRQSYWKSSRGEEARKMGKPQELISWWNRNIVVSYSRRQITQASDRLPAISGMAGLFASYIKSPYIAGIWLAELEEGLEWRRSGATYQSQRLDGPSFSWTSFPGPVDWPYALNVRPHGKAFDVIDYDVQLAGLDRFGKITSAQLTLHGHLRLVNMGPEEDDVDLSHKIRRSLLDDAGNKIGEIELDFHGFEGPVQCFLLYKTSFGFLRLLLVVTSAGETCNNYNRIGIGMIYPKYVSWLLDTEKQSICLV
jgi:hypothetical protein